MKYSPAIFPSFRRHLRSTFASALVGGLVLLLAGQSNADPAPVAEFHFEQAEKFAARALVFRTEGANVSAAIRKIGNP